MKLARIESGPVYTNAYVVIDEATKCAAIIDAPKDCAAAVLDIVNTHEATVVQILLTHSHWDHTADAAELKRMFNAPVTIHAGDEYRMLNPGNEMLRPPFPLEPLAADAHVVNDQIITIGSLSARVLCTPGHTEGGVCYYFESEGVLFTGDTLFSGSVGRTDFPGGSWDTLIASLTMVLMTLPDSVVVYPGHGPATTIGHEKLLNPFINGELAG